MMVSTTSASGGAGRSREIGGPAGVARRPRSSEFSHGRRHPCSCTSKENFLQRSQGAASAGLPPLRFLLQSTLVFVAASSIPVLGNNPGVGAKLVPRYNPDDPLGSSAGPVAPLSGQANALAQVAAPWHGASPRDLHREYNNIFRYGNRNAASHLWVKFLLERSHQMTHERLVSMFTGFCAVSGSPVGPHDYNRYKLTLDAVDGSGKVAGFMHYCCWPCVCDTQDFIRVDTRTVTTLSGERQYRFAVIGNPCEHPEELTKPFEDAFYRGMTTLERDAPELRCDGKVLIGAPLSDHGYVIINMFFDLPPGSPDTKALTTTSGPAKPGRIKEVNGVKYQDEYEYGPMCEDRKNAGYNSGMGEIFRRVAAVSPVPIPTNPPASSFPPRLPDSGGETGQQRRGLNSEQWNQPGGKKGLQICDKGQGGKCEEL